MQVPQKWKNALISADPLPHHQRGISKVTDAEATVVLLIKQAKKTMIENHFLTFLGVF